MKKQILYLLIIIVIILSGCKVDLPIAVCGLPDGIVYSNEVFPESKPDRKDICANPLNINEFVYVAYADNQHGIWKYNLLTSDAELVININSDFKPDWSVTDWLVFTSQNQIYKCKSNGDSLTQLTFEDRNYNPTWSPDGSQIIFEKNKDDTIATSIVTIDKDGNFIKAVESIDYAGDTFIWSPDGNKVAFWSASNMFEEYLIAWFNVATPENIYFLNKSVPKHEIVDNYIQWYSDSENILWSGNQSLYKTNIYTGDTYLVKYGCEYDYYDFTILADGQTIISRRQELTFVPSTDEEAASMGFGTIYVDYDLVKLNPDGTEEIIPY